MDSTPGEILTEGFLVKHCPNSITPSHAWKPRYFILKGHHLLYWKKRQHAVQSPNSPHCMIDLEGSTIEKVSLVEGKPPQFPHCLRVTTALIHHGAFLTYHFCVQEEEVFKTWYNCLRRAVGQPELPPSPPTQTKHSHTRSLSTGGGLGAIQRQPLQTLSSSPTSTLSPSSASTSSSTPKFGLDSVRHFQPIQLHDEDLDALLQSGSSTTTAATETPSIPSETIKEWEELTTDPKSPESSTGSPSSIPPAVETPTLESSSSEPTSTPTSPPPSTPDISTPSSATITESTPLSSSSEPTPKTTSTEATLAESSTASIPSNTLSSLSSSTPDVAAPAKTPAMTKKEEIQNEIARARMRVLQLEKSNKLTPPSTIASRFPVKVPPPEPEAGLFTTRNAIILLFLLILYWYFF